MRIREPKSLAAMVAVALLCLTVGASAQPPETYGPVRTGQTLWSIAGDLVPRYPSMTRYEIVAAIRSANPQAFADGQLRAAVSLLLPSEPTARTLAKRADLPAEQRSDIAASPLAADTSGSSGRPIALAPESDADATPGAGDPNSAVDTRSAQTPTAADSVDQTGLPPSNLDAPRQQIAEGNAQEAYAALLPRLPSEGGDPRFDYVFGIAALDVGESGQAVLALQRVVFADPSFAGARLDLARAYLATGDRDNARKELERVQRADPPPDIAVVVQQLLDAVDQDEAVATRPWSVRTFLTAGFDGNANASTSDEQFLGFQLDPRNQETESSFVGLGASGRLRYALGDNAGFTAGGRIAHRHFPDADFVDASLIRLESGLARYWDSVTASATGILHYGLLDGAFNNQGVAIESSLGYGAGSFGINLKIRGGTLQFRDSLSSQDVDQIAVGLTGLWQATPALGTSLTALTGSDDAREAGSPYSRDISGLRSALIWRATPTIATNLSIGWLNADYPDPFFGQQREDDQYTIALGSTISGWLPPQWRLEPAARFIDNDSTVTLFKYDRFEVGLTVSRQF